MHGYVMIQAIIATVKSPLGIDSIICDHPYYLTVRKQFL